MQCRSTLALLLVAVTLLLLSQPSSVQGYCNAMHHSGYGPRTSTKFPPGWNGLAETPFRGWRSWYAFYTAMNQPMIEGVIDALAAKNRTVKGWEGKVSLCDLGYCAAGAWPSSCVSLWYLSVALRCVANPVSWLLRRWCTPSSAEQASTKVRQYQTSLRVFPISNPACALLRLICNLDQL